MLILKRSSIWLIFILCISLSACGYRFAGSGSLPAGIKSVCIPVLNNRTSEAGIENTITNDLIYEFNRHDISVLSSKDKADSVLSGTVWSVIIHTIAYRDPTKSSERRVTVTVNLKLRSHSGKVVWSRMGLSDNEAYDVMSDKLETEKNKKEAILVLSKRLTETIYMSMTADF
jgi:outer membrane lipopolysaccharide assembly protein LptE/RlpB